MERTLKLNHKIKNHIIPMTLRFGSYYVYTIPYSQLILNHKNSLNKNKSGSVLESTGLTDEDIDTYRTLNGIDNNNKDIRANMESFMSNISVSNDPIMTIDDIVNDDEIVALESAFMSNSNEEYAKIMNGAIKVNRKGSMSSESVYDKDDFKDVSGCYTKLIDPRKLVEVKVTDSIIGYYYVTSSELPNAKISFSNSMKINLNNTKGQVINSESSFIGMLAEKIVRSMDKPFLEKNAKFKQLIMDSLIYNDTYKKKISYQFIPVDYITRYTVNEDVNGNGVSILYRSLFFGKLYLYMLIFKVLTILSKSNDQKMHYIKSSGIDKNTANNTQAVARNLKENQMSYTDLMSFGTAINKIGKAKDAFIPTGTQNERGIETDILSGQDVSLDTELMEMLLTNMINATGVPSVFMSYVNEADYSRTLIMANAKYIGRVVNLQIDFNYGNTDLYKKLMKYHTTIDQSLIDSFEYAFTPPKSLNNVNMSDLISNAEMTSNFILKSLIGENANPSEEDNILKDILFRKVSKELLPMIQWSRMDDLFTESKEELSKKLAERKANPPDDNM